MTDNPVTRAEFDQLVAAVNENTALTKEVRDVLGTFRVLKAVALWVTVIVGMGSALVSFIRTLKGT